MPDQSYRGTCLCGSVTYRWTGTPNWVGHCHCRSCRLNTGSAFTTFVGVPDGAWEWTGTMPATYASSPGTQRLFCATWGTPVAYRSDRDQGEIHFYLAAHDAPGDLTPTALYHSDEHVGWLPPPTLRNSG